MDQIIKVAWDLNENGDNRYRLVYEIAELAKKLVDETQMKKAAHELNFEEAMMLRDMIIELKVETNGKKSKS